MRRSGGGLGGSVCKNGIAPRTKLSRMCRQIPGAGLGRTKRSERRRHTTRTLEDRLIVRYLVSVTNNDMAQLGTENGTDWGTPLGHPMCLIIHSTHTLSHTGRVVDSDSSNVILIGCRHT